jgi:anti-sigma factor RsiW
MKCPELSLIEDYLGGELPADQRREMEVHLQTCSSCRALVERERALNEALRGQLLMKAPPELWVRVRESLETRTAPRSLPDWLWVLGMGLVVIVVGLVLGSLGGPYLEGIKAWIHEQILHTPAVKSLTDLGDLPSADWLTQLPSGSTMLVVNLAIGGIILCWGLWQMIKALRR